MSDVDGTVTATSPRDETGAPEPCRSNLTAEEQRIKDKLAREEALRKLEADRQRTAELAAAERARLDAKLQKPVNGPGDVRILPYPNPQMPPLPEPVQRQVPDMVDNIRNGRQDQADQAIREALAKYPDDPGVKALAKLIQRKVQAIDSKGLEKKIGAIALDTRETEGDLTPNLAGLIAMGPSAAGPGAAAYAPGAAGAAGVLGGITKVSDLRGAQAPVLDAAAHIKIGDHAAAVAGLTKHLEVFPKDAPGWGLLALAEYKQKRYEPSIRAAQKALDLNRLDERARGVKTLDYLALERYADAETEASYALSLNPRNAHAYVQRAEARLALGRQAEHLADLKAAAEIDAQYASLYEDALTGRKRGGAPSTPGLTKRSALWIGAAGTAFLFLSFAVYRKRGDTTMRAALRHDDHAAAVAQAPRVDAVPQGFQVVRTLGQGGMGVVYEAVDLALQRTVALKKMRDEVAVNPRERARFLKEARVVAGLKHPNIVEIYSIQENPEGLFLVFERVPGMTLHERLGKGAMSPAEAVSVLRQVAAALDYAHAVGVVHQDLKPANIMVHGGQVKVMDFGIARRVQETLSTMSRVEVAGTPAYMAPEQEQGVGVGPAADLFALGVCAYESLSGNLPFPQGGIMAKIQGAYRPVTDNSLTPLPKSVDEPIARALDPMPGKRHASASAFIDALARSLA